MMLYSFWNGIKLICQMKIKSLIMICDITFEFPMKKKVEKP